MTEPLYDCCIVGSGAAGGILAHQLAKSGLSVITVEQGDELPPTYFTEDNPPGVAKWQGIRRETSFPPKIEDALFIHDLFARHSTRSSSKSSESQFRQFQIYALGGLQNLWNGVSVRFSEDDFARWPIKYTDLAAHYSAVEQRINVCGTKEGIAHLPDGEFNLPKPLREADKLIINAVKRLDWPDSYAIPNRKAIETRPDKKNRCISSGICTFGCPVGAMYKFSVQLLPEIRQRDNYRLLLNAKVTRLIRDKITNRISSLHYLDVKTGQQHELHAKVFILAAGALETPRILFNSRDDDFSEGLANSSGTLGAYLQDNPKVVLSSSLYKLWFSKRPADVGYGDLLILLGKSKLASGAPFNFIGHSIASVPDIPYYLSSLQNYPQFLKKPLVKMMFNSFVTLGLFCEGDVTLSNRLTPSKDHDQYGVPQVDIHYTSSPDTIERMKKMAVFGKKVLRNASATKIVKSYSNDGTGIHYAGTCRMGDQAREAIVDANLKTFEHDNLYLCDGGVIPHLPDKHLTLTIMALADRLAQHLINEFGSGRI